MLSNSKKILKSPMLPFLLPSSPESESAADKEAH